MRILLHDYSGHPFPAQLGRALAGRGHEVLHVSCSSYRTGKGALTASASDPPTFTVRQIALRKTFERYSATSRLYQELEYGAAFSKCAAEYGPDVVLSCNDPLVAKSRSAWWCRRTRTPWVFWLQDLYSVAMGKYLRSRLGPPGAVVAWTLRRVERRLLHEANAVIAITDDFRETLSRWGVPENKFHVIENWAPIEEIPLKPKENDWAIARRLHDRFVFLYSGTLGLKHNPALLLDLAEEMRSQADACVVVVSQGRGADWLKRQTEQRKLDNLVVLPFQPYDQLPSVLATADVFLVLLEEDAGIYSVPSKVLTYLCAARPIIAAMPTDNLGARTIELAGAGIVVGQRDPGELIGAAAAISRDSAARENYGRNGRRFAEATFDIIRISCRFERILVDAARGNES